MSLDVGCSGLLGLLVPQERKLIEQFAHVANLQTVLLDRFAEPSGSLSVYAYSWLAFYGVSTFYACR